MRYLVVLQPDDGGFAASFPYIPEALTSGATREEALDMALDALVTALDFYFDDKVEVPAPRKIPADADFVELPASVAAKVLLLNEMVRQQVRPAELARRMGTTPQVINRIVNLHYTTRVDTVQSALSVLGKRLELSLARGGSVRSGSLGIDATAS